jgi:hypothetical protein
MTSFRPEKKVKMFGGGGWIDLILTMKIDLELTGKTGADL